MSIQLQALKLRGQVCLVISPDNAPGQSSNSYKESLTKLWKQNQAKPSECAVANLVVQCILSE